MNDPSLDIERSAFEDFDFVLGADEVGRGCAAGPAYVGVCGLKNLPPSFPEGVKDSKLLTPRQRRLARSAIETWADMKAVGACSNEEIDSLGITLALGLALERALSALGDIPGRGLLILDGNFDYLSLARKSLHLSQRPRVEVKCVVKGDMKSALCASASILAKLDRDELMDNLSKLDNYKGYKWKKNKGYPTREHIEAIKKLGLSPLHRKTWKIKGLDGEFSRKGLPLF
ncbi:MAG: ribonuclease HII [Aeriscardovia sp.]|nr:ribonuclease HII [Aeriscardovia sp.]MBP5785808.1 ribonuclease HII [Aeriscardovia sp.]